MTTPALRPRSATEIIDISFQILRRNYGALVTLSVASMLPLAAITVFSAMATSGVSKAGGGAADAAFGVMAFVFIFASFIFYFVAQNAVMVGASQAYLGEPVRAGAALRRAARRLLPLVLLIIVVGIGIMLGFFLFIIPGLYLMLRCVPLAMVTVLEDGDPGETLSRMWALGRNNVGHILVVVVVLWFIYFAVAIIMQVMLVGGLMLFPGTAAAGAGSILIFAVIALFYPFFQTVFVALYYDLRIRHEGLDVEMMTQALGETAPQA